MKNLYISIGSINNKENFSLGYIMNEIEPVKVHSAKYRIENIVISVSFHSEIDLEKIAENYQDADFNLNKFPGLCIRITKPKCTILLFKNGKMIITGLKNSKEAPIVVNRVSEKLTRIGIVLDSKPEFKIVNLVVSLNFQHRINLDEASLFLSHSIYEPEVFPGLIFRNLNPITCVFLIFSSGKVVLTGLKSEADIIPAIKILGFQLKKKGILD